MEGGRKENQVCLFVCLFVCVFFCVCLFFFVCLFVCVFFLFVFECLFVSSWFIFFCVVCLSLYICLSLFTVAFTYRKFTNQFFLFYYNYDYNFYHIIFVFNGYENLNFQCLNPTLFTVLFVRQLSSAPATV